MGRRLLVAILVAFVAVFVYNQSYIAPLPAHDELPSPIAAFLKEVGLSQSYKALDTALNESRSPRPGQSNSAFLKQKHPVVIVPGIISCGLEVWKAKPCMGNAFRKRVWGGADMIQAIIYNPKCWMEHISPDPLTGIDREGVKVKAAGGLAAADYFLPGYWLWSKIIENLGDIGYDSDSILMACYDWRLAFPILETRDKFFSKLKRDISFLVMQQGEKAVVLGHSMGANVWLYFMSWVEHHTPGWVDEHINTFVNIGGAVLGGFGPLAFFMSGEMDGAQMFGPMGAYMESLTLSAKERRDFAWSLGGLGSLLPIGGTTVWGSESSGWTDSPVNSVSLSNVLIEALSGANMDLEQLYARAEKLLSDYKSWNSYFRFASLPKTPSDARTWSNPLASALPKASKLKIHCLYGVGLSTERSYFYSRRAVRWAFSNISTMRYYNPVHWSRYQSADSCIVELERYAGGPKSNRSVYVDAGSASGHFQSVSEAIEFLAKAERHLEEAKEGNALWLRINSTFNTKTPGPWGNMQDGVYKGGVSFTDGDGTVPLLSLGYMCGHGWRNFSALNPSKIPVWTKEYEHLPAPVFVDPRGGPKTAKHVEIIGNTELIGDILHMVSGNSKHLETDRFISNITRIGPIVTERLRRVFG